VPLISQRRGALSGYFYLISSTLLADFLQISVSTAFSYKKATGKAGFIGIYPNKQYFPGISEEDIEHHLDELRKHNPRLRVDSHGCYEYLPDLIQFNIIVKKRNKSKKE
jgi:hypothetical protein